MIVDPVPLVMGPCRTDIVDPVRLFDAVVEFAGRRMCDVVVSGGDDDGGGGGGTTPSGDPQTLLHIGSKARLFYTLYRVLSSWSPSSVRRRTPREWETRTAVHRGGGPGHGVSLIGMRGRWEGGLWRENKGAGVTVRRIFGFKEEEGKG